MRVVNEIVRENCKITIYHWNNRFILKLENGFLEQTFKLNEWDITSENELEQLLDPEFVKEAESRFKEMNASLARTKQRLDGI